MLLDAFPKWHTCLLICIPVVAHITGKKLKHENFMDSHDSPEAWRRGERARALNLLAP